VFLYQEQVINFFMQLGYDLQEADEIRALMGKKKKVEKRYRRCNSIPFDTHESSYKATYGTIRD
jgi:hypothetical protein